MRALSWLTGICALALAAMIALVPRTAYAQATPTVGGIVGVVQRLEPNGANADNSNENPHPNGVLVNDVNFEDCQADLSYSFDLSIPTINTQYNLNIWAGSASSGDCSQLTNRQAATAVCWPVLSPTLATTNPFPVQVRMQNIVSQIFTSTHTVTFAESSSDVCQLQTATGSTNVTLYFFFTDQSGNPVGSEATYPLTVSLRAGDVQGNISVGVGDTLLIVDVPPTTDTSVQQWNVYCDPPPGQEGALETVPVDAASNNGVCSSSGAGSASSSSGGSPTLPEDGAVSSSDASEDGAPSDASLVSGVDSAPPVEVDDAGGNACGAVLNDAQIPSPGGCSASSVLTPGGTSSGLTSYVDEAGQTIFEEAGTVTASEEGGTSVAVSGGQMRLIPSKYKCGTSGVTSTQINVLGLKDGYYYNIAVAAVDALGNVGPLSNVACGEPVPVNDFWKIYYEDGGRAGGGFCSTDGVGTPAGTTGLGALTLASIAAIIRRRRRS